MLHSIIRRIQALAALVLALNLAQAHAAEISDAEIRAAQPVQRLYAGGRMLSSGARVAVFAAGAPVDFGGASLYQSRGRLLVPLRPICEALGAKVSFDAGAGLAIVQRGNLVVRAGGTTVGGRTLLQLRPLCDALGATLTAKTGVVTVYSIAFPSGGAPLSLAPSAAAPATPGADDITVANIQHNLDQLNYYRAKARVPPLKLDEKLNAFALAGSVQLMKDHIPHHHFTTADVWANGFVGGAAENQGDPNGWFPGEVNKTIDDILQAMINEGPGGGHHDNMLNPAFRRVGVGLIKDSEGKLYFTNDFSQ